MNLRKLQKQKLRLIVFSDALDSRLLIIQDSFQTIEKNSTLLWKKASGKALKQKVVWFVPLKLCSRVWILMLTS
jgi:hypothetical protein